MKKKTDIDRDAAIRALYQAWLKASGYLDGGTRQRLNQELLESLPASVKKGLLD